MDCSQSLSDNCYLEENVMKSISDNYSNKKKIQYKALKIQAGNG